MTTAECRVSIRLQLNQLEIYGLIQFVNEDWCFNYKIILTSRILQGNKIIKVAISVNSVGKLRHGFFEVTRWSSVT